MPVFAFIVFVFAFILSIGLLVQAFRPAQDHVSFSTLAKYGIGGTAIIMLVLHIVVFFIPLRYILRPEVYVSFFGGSIAAYIFLKPKIDRLFVIGALLYFFTSCYVFSSEIARNSLVSFGGNGDFFNHQRMMTFLWNFSVRENVQLPLGYGIAQEYVDWGRYPIGSHILMNVFSAPFTRYFPELVAASWQKIFLSIAVFTLIVFLPRSRSTSVSTLVITSVITLPLLQSVVGMDFMSQLASFTFVVAFGFSVLKKEHIQALVYLIAVIVLYYPAVIVLVPSMIWWCVLLFREKKYSLLLALLSTALVSGLYFWPNISSFPAETEGLGGLGTQFPFLELVGILPLYYGPYMLASTKLPVLFASPSIGVGMRVVYGLMIAVISLFWLRKYIQDKHSDRWLLYSSLCAYALLCIAAYLFFPPYITYKVFTLGSIALLPFVLEGIQRSPWLDNKKVSIALLCAAGLVTAVNLDQGYYYHNNPLRWHYQELPHTAEYKMLQSLFDRDTVLLHRNIGVTSLLSLQALDKHLYTKAFYFNNYSSAMLPNVDQTQLCDTSIYNPTMVRQILIEEGVCQDTLPSELLSRHTFYNSEITRVVISSE